MKRQIISILAILVVILGIAWFLNRNAEVDSHRYDAFTSCIAKSGAKFFGAFWCPHCREQKALFEASVKLLPYVECSNPDGQSQTQVCIDNKIISYPTWIFANGERMSGTLDLNTLSAKTTCLLPGATSTPQVSGVARTPGATSSATQVN